MRCFSFEINSRQIFLCTSIGASPGTFTSILVNICRCRAEKIMLDSKPSIHCARSQALLRAWSQVPIRQSSDRAKLVCWKTPNFHNLEMEIDQERFPSKTLSLYQPISMFGPFMVFHIGLSDFRFLIHVY